MPKRRNRNVNSRSAARGNRTRFTSMGTTTGSGLVREYGSGLINMSVANGNTSGQLAVNLATLGAQIPRLQELMNAYQLFRFTRIQIKIPPQVFDTVAPALTKFVSFAFCAGDPTTTTALTTASILCLPGSVFSSSQMTEPITLTLTRKILVAESQSKWYKTQPSAAVESWEEDQGNLLVVFSAAATANRDVFAHMEYELELCSLTPPALLTLAKEPMLAPGFLDFLFRKFKKRLAQDALAITE